MALRGVRKVHAFDVRSENVVRARRLGKYFGATNLEVSRGDVYKLNMRRNSYDVVYNVGLFYHINDPLKLARITYNLTRDFAVFDTIAHKDPYAGYVQEIHTEDVSRRASMGVERMELHPTYRGIIDLIRYVGFQQIYEVVPRYAQPVAELVRNVYTLGLRRTFIAIKHIGRDLA